MMERDNLQDLDRDGGYMNGFLEEICMARNRKKRWALVIVIMNFVVAQNAANLLTILETDSFQRIILLQSVIQSGKKR